MTSAVLHYLIWDSECLRGQWGVAEVADAADSIKELGDLGVIDPSRSVIRGGSAGELKLHL